ncbi:hypothetical protein FHX48_001451 [Microbacterium halimionae]|uniref:TrwC relaxase domain-containing protein n=1 Tax=Microbacterium halimionae TaxID=1526413 RepID=A0A7W3JP96_9MICO|nr:hypothetical protein [Microbacterium halimionae]NII96580.1 hypothetical protein [Microbacterium halimionae]
MTVSMRVMSAGDGYKYLLRTVASGDGDRDLSTPLTRYYAEKGSPPGRWLGSAVPALGGGAITVGDQVTETQLQLLVGMGRDPVTGDALASACRNYPSVAASYQPSRRSAPGLIVGLIPRAVGPLDARMRLALEQREHLMQHRVAALTQAVFQSPEPWARNLISADQDAVEEHLKVVIAYRDRWEISSGNPLGAVPMDDAQRIDYERALGHVEVLWNFYENNVQGRQSDTRSPSRSIREEQ